MLPTALWDVVAASDALNHDLNTGKSLRLTSRSVYAKVTPFFWKRWTLRITDQAQAEAVLATLARSLQHVKSVHIDLRAARSLPQAQAAKECLTTELMIELLDRMLAIKRVSFVVDRLPENAACLIFADRAWKSITTFSYCCLVGIDGSLLFASTFLSKCPNLIKLDVLAGAPRGTRDTWTRVHLPFLRNVRLHNVNHERRWPESFGATSLFSLETLASIEELFVDDPIQWLGPSSCHAAKFKSCHELSVTDPRELDEGQLGYFKPSAYAGMSCLKRLNLISRAGPRLTLAEILSQVSPRLRDLKICIQMQDLPASDTNQILSYAKLLNKKSLSYLVLEVDKSFSPQERNISDSQLQKMVNLFYVVTNARLVLRIAQTPVSFGTSFPDMTLWQRALD